MACAVFASGARAEVTVVDVGDDLRAALTGLVPGDTISLAPGTHVLTQRMLLEATGTAVAPIVITSLDPENPAIIRRVAADQNIIDIGVGHYLVIDNVRFQGGSRGVRLIETSDVTFTRCEIFDTDDVALSANDSGQDYERLTITHNNLHDTGGTGEGIYFGCNGDT